MVPLSHDNPPSRQLAIGSVSLESDLILAPMVGYSDPPYRLICREHGSALSYTPLLLDRAIVMLARRGKPLIDFLPEERPIAFQLVSADPVMLAEAAHTLARLSPDILDLNLGCPARKVVSRGRGAALLRQPNKIHDLVTSLVKAANCPVTAKIRLGWDDDSLNYLEVAQCIEEAGAAAVGVHGRTRAQGYGGEANWEAIAEVRDALGVPVLANGDVRDAGDVARIKAVTGCDLVLIGRGAIGNPWIFGRRDLSDVSPAERVAMMRRHLNAMVTHYGEARGVILFRKHAIKYTRGLPGSAALRARIVTTKTLEDTLLLLASWNIE